VNGFQANQAIDFVRSLDGKFDFITVINQIFDYIQKNIDDFVLKQDSESDIATILFYDGSKILYRDDDITIQNTPS